MRRVRQLTRRFLLRYGSERLVKGARGAGPDGQGEVDPWGRPFCLLGKEAKSFRTFFCGPQSYRWLNCSFNLPLDRELARSLLAAGFFFAAHFGLCGFTTAIMAPKAGPILASSVGYMREMLPSR